MPIYEFDCQDCGKPFETLVIGFSTDGVRCPECQGKNVKKKISSFAVKGATIGAPSFSSNSASCAAGST
jgi:putative FmdB family regulatory protein